MKLTAKYNQVSLLTSLITLLVTGVIYYLVINFILTRQLDRDLVVEESEILEYVHHYAKLPLPGYFKDQQVQFTLLPAGEQAQRVFADIAYTTASSRKPEPGRSLKTQVKLAGRQYQVLITKSRVQANYLIRIIFVITISVTCLVLAGLALVNRLVFKHIWNPFFKLLAQMRGFNITGGGELPTEPSHIDEFNELNASASTLTRRAKADYTKLKTFADNASHEMMTPIAVVNSKLDMLLQTGPFSDKQGNLLEDIYTSVNRLSRLNQSLLLLAKIEHQLIPMSEEIEIGRLVTEKVKQFAEKIEANELIMEVNVTEARTPVTARYLADILINNLMSNAIKHNISNGHIMVTCTGGVLTISNTGLAQPLETEKVFERFQKGSTSDGMGLGLAICQEICTCFKFKLDYSFTYNLHTFQVYFSQ